MAFTPNQELVQKIAFEADQELRQLDQAAEIVGGKGASPLEVFAPPTEVRDDAPMPSWNEQQTSKILGIARRLGYGAEKDVLTGLKNPFLIIEAGKVWKVQAELNAALKEDEPVGILFAGSPDRKIGDDERDFMDAKLKLRTPENTTEFEAVELLANRYVQENGQATHSEIPFGYELAEGNPLVEEYTGQIQSLGRGALSEAVHLVRVDREDYFAEDRSSKFRFRPSPERLMTMSAEILRVSGMAGVPVGLVTSSTYAGRRADLLAASLHFGHEFGLGLYGRETLRELRAPVPKQAPLNQLPGDLRNRFEKLSDLRLQIAATYEV